MVDVKKLIAKWKSDYETRKSKEMEELYNAIVDVISEKQAYRPHAIAVLRLLEWEMLQSFYRDIQKKRGPPKVLSKKPPEPITEQT